MRNPRSSIWRSSRPDALAARQRRRVIRALERGGFRVTHIRGSHHYLRRGDEPRLVVVPVHGDRDLPVGTLRSILRQADLTAEELAELL